jgi:hypothetical protein
MSRHLGGRHRVTAGKHARGACTGMGFLLGVLGLLACLVGCAGPNPFERARPPDALAWDEARLADSPYFYQRFLTQYPTSAFARHARARLEALEWAVVQKVDGVPDYARFIRAYPDSVWVPQAQARLTELEEQNARSQDINARVNCPQLQDRVHAYTTAVEQTLADMAQLPPDRRQRPRLSTTDLPHLPTVFRAIRDYQSTVAAVQAAYGTLPLCHLPHQGHLPHKEIAYVAFPTTDGNMLLLHMPVYGPLRGETIWQIGAGLLE